MTDGRDDGSWACPRCSTENATWLQFCGSCGSQRVAARPPAHVVAAAAAAERRTTRLTAALGVAGATALVAVGAVVVGALGGGGDDGDAAATAVVPIVDAPDDEGSREARLVDGILPGVEDIGFDWREIERIRHGDDVPEPTDRAEVEQAGAECGLAPEHGQVDGVNAVVVFQQRELGHLVAGATLTPDDAEAQRLLDDMADPVFVECLRARRFDEATEQLGAGRTIESIVEPIPSPAGPDAFVGHRFVVNVSDGRQHADSFAEFVYLRVGRVAMTVMIITPEDPLDPVIRDRLVERFSERARGLLELLDQPS